MVNPQKTVRFMVPKYVLESLGFKLQKRGVGRSPSRPTPSETS
ncbi:MAG: hypothetical protein ACLT98_04280 [Eggerthellaceae bacterium]